MTLIRIKETDSQIKSKILRGLASELNVAISKAIHPIRRDVSALTHTFFKNSSTYRALLEGPLDGHFGIPKGTAFTRLENIIQKWMESTTISHQFVIPLGDRLKGGLTVSVIYEDYNDVLSLADAIITTDKEVVLQWLDWLLTKGNRIIVTDYHIKFGSFRSPKPSRSGKAIMYKKGSWGVPANYAGTVNNNWVTRTILDLAEKYERAVERIIIKNLENYI